MPLTRPIYKFLRLKLAATALILCGIGLMPTAALAEPEIGHIIISRDVGPRNALTPEVGLRHTVATAPDPADLAFAGQVSAITDAQASEINGSTFEMGNIGGSLQGPLEFLAGSEQMATDGTISRSTGGFIGETVGGSIAGGMTALAGVLASLPMNVSGQ